MKGEVERAMVLKGGKDSRKGYGGNERGRAANIGWTDGSIVPRISPFLLFTQVGRGARTSGECGVKISEQARSGPEV